MGHGALGKALQTRPRLPFLDLPSHGRQRGAGLWASARVSRFWVLRFAVLLMNVDDINPGLP